MIDIHRTPLAAGGSITRRRVVRTLAFAFSIVAAIGTVPASAQQRGNPFAARPFGGAGPYGSDAGAMPHLMHVPQIMAPPVSSMRQRSMAGVARKPNGELPEPPEVSEANRDDGWEAIFVGCTAGGFLGGFSAATTTSLVATGTATAAVPVGMALPVLAGAVASAAAIGCGVGVATAAVSVSAATLWRWLAR